MANDKRKIVKFGLKNAHYALWDETAEKYLDPKPLMGSVSLSISPEGDTSTFYADDGSFYTTSPNGGYTGSIELANLTGDAMMDLFGYLKDDNGMYLEDADAVFPTFALMFEVSSNIEPERFTFYNCTATRPSGEHNTKAESTDPDTVTMDFSAVSRDFDWGGETKKFVKGFLPKTDTNAEKYSKYFESVQLPVKAA